MDDTNEPGDQQELVNRANAALEHIAATPAAWITVIDAYAAGRSIGMVRSGSNKPSGKGYVLAFNSWVARTGFNMKRADDQTRHAMGKIIDNRAAFDDWLKTLTPSQRQLWTHPRTLERHFAASRRESKPAKTKAGLEEQVRGLTAKVDVLTAEKLDSSVVFNLAGDKVDEIVAAIMAQPAALRNERKMADIGRKLAKVAEAALRRRAAKIGGQ